MRYVMCGDCQCWEPKMSDDFGDCRRRAPFPMPILRQNFEEYDDQPFWPEITFEQGCFEGIPKEEPEDG